MTWGEGMQAVKKYTSNTTTQIRDGIGSSNKIISYQPQCVSNKTMAEDLPTATIFTTFEM
jgi:hypothetical protein